MENSKWFYPAQRKITKFLAEKYGIDNYRCEFQDVCKNVVYETYAHWDDDALKENNGNPAIVTFIIHKNHSLKSAPALITVLHGKYEDTMQYFAEQ